MQNLRNAQNGAAIYRLTKWVFTYPMSALRFFLAFATIIFTLWSFFSTTSSYASAVVSNSMTFSQHLIFYIVCIGDIVILLALPFLLRLYDRRFHLTALNASVGRGCMLLIAWPAAVFSVMWGLSTTQSSTVPHTIETIIMDSLYFIALAACTFLCARFMRVNKKAQTA